MKIEKLRRPRIAVVGSLALLLLAWWMFSLPSDLFHSPSSTVLWDKDGQLIGARIAADGQWRFPQCDSVPARFTACILAYEDHRFYQHSGLSLPALFRASRQNILAGTTVSGASTITMQLMRMSRQNHNRSAFQKIIEMAWATRAEFRYSKKEILKLYVSHAPFGGNVVGLDAAAWRYFARPAYELTWAESAVLAVLPNAPGLIYPGRNPKQLLKKRNLLLERLYKNGTIDELTLNLSHQEPLPGSPISIPQDATHLLASTVGSELEGRHIVSTISGNLQRTMSELVNMHVEVLSRNFIHNAALLVVDVETGEVAAYVGNASNEPFAKNIANDMVLAPRSSGSILKPFLYGQMVGKGIITPGELVADIPTQYAGFAPKNYDETYGGAVPANIALARSLNIPAVRMLRTYGVPVFHQDLNRMGFSTITKHPSHYGLSLILGGAECTLWDLASAYRNIAAQTQWGSGIHSLQPVHYAGGDTIKNISEWPIEQGAAWCVTEALSEVNRPEEEANWDAYAGADRIAWKTGTSYGFRDAWAVGYNRQYVVAVWVGNATGEGRPGITGINAAAPLLFRAFNALPSSPWFEPPQDALTMADICASSGMLASDRCKDKDYRLVPKSALETQACTYCRWIHMNPDGTKRVTTDCCASNKMQKVQWFVLPPLQEWFYKKNNPSYRILPPWENGCQPDVNENPMQLIYPRETSKVFIPREVNGVKESVVFKAAHRRAEAILYWHINNNYLGSTQSLHHMDAIMEPGEYMLLIVDEEGYQISKNIVVE